MANEFGRNIKDSGLSVSKALPAAGASNQTATIDLSTAVGLNTENLELEVSIPAIAASTDSTKNVTLTLQHSSDDSTYASLDDGTGTLPGIVITTPGVASTGSAARVVRLRIPRGVSRYLQFTQAVTSGASSLVGSSITYSLRF